LKRRLYRCWWCRGLKKAVVVVMGGGERGRRSRRSGWLFFVGPHISVGGTESLFERRAALLFK
jgi:hypothetical protein